MVSSAIDPASLTAALAGGQGALLRAQGADGAWLAFCDMGPMGTAQVVVVLRYLDRLPAADADAAGRWLCAQQLPGGGFPLHPLATEGSPTTTAYVWAALRAVGLPDDHPVVAASRAFVTASGGLTPFVERLAMGDPTAVFLAMAGLVPARELPDPPAAVVALPGVERWLEKKVSLAIPFTALQVGVLVHHLRGDWGPGHAIGKLFGTFERRACLELMNSLQNEDGSYFWGDSLHGCLSLAVLQALGVPAGDPRVVKATAWLDGQRRRGDQGLWWSVFQTDVWPTAFCVRALLASGLPADHPDVVRAVRWLVDAQIPFLGRPGDGLPDFAAAPVTWSFQRRNTTSPDPDDAVVALGAVGLWLDAAGRARQPPGDLVDAAEAAASRCLGWLEAMQNNDGGWSSLQHNLPSKPAGAIMTEAPSPPHGLRGLIDFLRSPPPALGDPATEDVTGRALFALGHNDATLASPPVSRALAFLQREQADNGGFWGRWVVNFLAGTAWVVRGLAAVGADRKTPWIDRAVAFLLAKQNADGGWGEDVASYRDPSLAGQGPSTPQLTGLVLAALVEVGEGRSAAAARGARYLLDGQRPDGTWSPENTLHTMLPPYLFYTLPYTELELPLEALGLYARLARGESEPEGEDAATRARARRITPPPLTEPPRRPDGRWNEAYLEAMLAHGDPPADAVIDEIYASADRAGVEALVARIMRSDAPLPPGLPPETARFFTDTASLPAWADPLRLSLAAELFARTGWGVATILFTSSLPQLYAFPLGARVLVMSDGIPNHAWRRIVETAQFVFDVTASGGFAEGGRALPTVQKVRLMHAGIRHLVLARTRWEDAWGVPINQQHLAGTLMTFSSVVVDGLRGMGIAVDDAEADAWLHLWKVVGALLGLRPELLPRDLADERALFAVLRDRSWGASPEGAELAQATVKLMQQLFGGEGRLARLPAALVRHLAGDRCADLLGLPPEDRRESALADAVTWLDEAVAPAAHGDPFIVLAQKAAMVVMRALAAHARQGKQVSFRIPDTLIRRWDGDHPRL
jgi:squalene cyclase